jgi:hypothetical protein
LRACAILETGFSDVIKLKGDNARMNIPKTTLSHAKKSTCLVHENELAAQNFVEKWLLCGKQADKFRSSKDTHF